MNSSSDFQSYSASLFQDPASLVTGRSVLGGLVAAYFVYVLLSSINQSRKGKLPPGPRGIPIFGNMFQLTADAWVQFADWGKQYGDMVYIRAAGHGMLILNSHKVCNDIMEQRAAIYSDRPRLVVASEILTGGMIIPFAGYNEFWRRMRRASHEGLNNNTARNYYPAQLREAVLLVEGMLKDSRNWDDELKRAAQSMILGVVYDNGVIADCKDPNITYVNDFIARIVRAAFPGAHYAEFFPIMKYLPVSIAKWKRDALNWYRRDGEYFGALYKDVKDRIENGDERHSFSATLVHDEKQLELSEDERSWLAATIFATGGETTSTVMSWFILAMVKYPAAAKAAQAELDRVIGRDRMPTFADRDSLPYLVACVRETLRWKTVAPVGVPHRSIEDDWYDGYFIPKGTIVIPNQWAMNKDERVYGSDAEDFKPERHLDADGNLAPAPFGTHDEGHVGYGFGRRICVGRHVANNSLFMDMACLLWACNIEPIKDAKGKPVIPDSEKFVNDGLVLRPWPFQCSVTQRFPGAADIVAATREMLVE